MNETRAILRLENEQFFSLFFPFSLAGESHFSSFATCMGSIEDSVDRCPSGLVLPRKADVCAIGTHFFTCGDIKLADSYQDSL